jgi:VWFA-related protein
MRLPRLAAIFLLSTLSWAQDPVFRASVSQVKVDAQVSDLSGLIDGLQGGDFLVKDNGKPQHIVYCSQDEEPLDIVLLFDISGSMGPSDRKVAASAYTAMAELRHGDRVAIASFNTATWLEEPFNDNLTQVARRLIDGIRQTRFGGGTYILDAIDNIASYFLKQSGPHRRRAVVIFSDDQGFGFKSERSVVRRMWEADAVLSGLIIGDPRMQNGWPHLSSPDTFTGVAEQTGGEVVTADPPGPAFQEMMRRLRKRYSLYYAMPPAKNGEYRRVTVELSGQAKTRYPKALVLARKGYRASKTGFDAP